MLDTHNQTIHTGQTVRIFGQEGKVCHIHGALGIVIPEGINWNHFIDRIKVETGTDNRPYFCMNDNFISFWEIAWNYNLETDCFPMVEILNTNKENNTSIDCS